MNSSSKIVHNKQEGGEVPVVVEESQDCAQAIISEQDDDSKVPHEGDLAIDIHTLTIDCIVRNKEWHWSKGFYMLNSLIIIAAQFFVVMLLSVDIFQTKCSVHTDCPSGMFCGVTSEREEDKNKINILDSYNGRCSECDLLWEYKNHNRSFTDIDFCESYWKESPMNLWATDVLQPFDDHDHSSLPDGYRLNDNIQNNTFIYCPAVHHCLSTDAIHNKCDFVRFNRDFLDFTSVIFLLFVTALISATIKEDIVFAKKQIMYLTQTSPNGIFKHILSSFLVAKRFGLPFMIVQAFISLMVSQPLKPTTILLNALSIAFILESDDFIGKFWIDKEREEDVIKHYQKSYKPSQVSKNEEMRGRVFDFGIPILCSLMILSGIFYVENLIARLGSNFFPPMYDLNDKSYNCYDISFGTFGFAIIGAVLVVILNLVLILVWQENRRALQSIRLLSGVVFAFLVCFLQFAVQSSFESSSWTEFRNTLWWLCLGLFIFYGILVFLLIWLGNRFSNEEVASYEKRDYSEQVSA